VPKPIQFAEVIVIATDGATPPGQQGTTCILPKVLKDHKVAAKACLASAEPAPKPLSWSWARWPRSACLP
jgi:hypothetical protein